MTPWTAWRNAGALRRTLAQGAKRWGRLEVVRLAGIEPTTLGFGGQYSIH